MAENKKHPEEETKIEQLNDNLTKAGVKVEENKKTLMIIVGAVIAVGLLVAAYFYFFYNPGIDKAFDAYGKVEIENGTASETAKAEAYKKVADQYEGSDAGKLAALEAAENYYDAGNYKAALAYLDKFDTSDDILAANVQIMKGDCYVNLKKYPEAIKEFEAVAASQADNSEIAPRARLKIATVYEAQKKNNEALGIYERIKKDFPAFNVAGMSMDAYIERAKSRLGK